MTSFKGPKEAEMDSYIILDTSRIQFSKWS